MEITELGAGLFRLELQQMSGEGESSSVQFHHGDRIGLARWSRTLRVFRTQSSDASGILSVTTVPRGELLEILNVPFESRATQYTRNNPSPDP